MPEKESRVLYRFREDTENRSPSSCRASRCSDRQPDPAPPPRGLKLEPSLGVLREVVAQPDPAPPPRGLKRNKPALVLMDIGHVLEPNPAPPPRGLKLEPSWTALSS